jgi:hypothetical protein
VSRRGFIDGEYQDGEVRGLITLAGKRGMGKTTEMIRVLMLCTGIVIFFDTVRKHTLRGFLVVSQPGELKAALRRGVKRIHYMPAPGSSRLAHFDAVCAIALAVGWLVLAVDEIDRVCKRDDDSEAVVLPANLKELVECGRHYRVSMLFTFRKPPYVPRGLTSEAEEHRLFRTTENRYVKYWADTIGDDDAARRLRTLPKYHYLRCVDGGDPEQMCAGKHVA